MDKASEQWKMIYGNMSLIQVILSFYLFGVANYKYHYKNCLVGIWQYIVQIIFSV